MMRLEWALAGLLLAAVLGSPAVRANQDSEGYMWDLQGDGSVSDGGNDTYDGGLTLLVNDQAFPLELKVPNAQTRAAMKEARTKMKARALRFESTGALIDDLEKAGRK